MSGIQKGVGWLFLVSGLANIVGVLFSANGANLEVGLFNSIVGYLMLAKEIKPKIKNLLAKYVK